MIQCDGTSGTAYRDEGPALVYVARSRRILKYQLPMNGRRPIRFEDYASSSTSSEILETS